MQPTTENKSNATATEREVTDPVTHLPLTIHDNTSIELEQIPPPSSQSKRSSEPEASDKKAVSNKRHATMEDIMRAETQKGWWEDQADAEDKRRIYTALVAAGAAGAGGMGSLVLFSILGIILGRSNRRLGVVDLLVGSAGSCIFALGAAICVFFFSKSHQPSPPRTNNDRKSKPTSSKKPQQESPESAAWLNSLLTSIWPIINPALFASAADILEDSLQATLPKLVHGVRVADIGQGSEPLRILGIRWLEAGDAAIEKDGMKAEEGDFVNLEVAVAYRSKSTKGSGLKGRSGNAHLLVQFWTTGGLMIPVWVELHGILTTARLRIQLSPNPPFLSVLTLTLLGQPKVSLTCTPLAKNFLNVMDVPGLSGWLQRSIDSAVAEYVAPRSLNLDLKTILMGREKMDTDAVGVVFVRVRKAIGFKDGDGEKIWATEDEKKGDVYVTLGWGKWGKPLWSTRIIDNEKEPVWDEITALLVGPAELNAQERLRLQLWDSDRTTADDLLGTVELPLKDIMTGSGTQNQISSRKDNFTGSNDSQWPGSLEWDVGYFSKTTLHQQLSATSAEVDEIERNIEKEAEEKLREAKTRDDGDDESGEIKQQKKEDLKQKSDEIIAGTKPSREWISGVLSIRIEQIHGLEVQKIQESGVNENGEDEESDDMPSAYCTVIINHQRVYKTRTKLKSNKPFFDAGTERFIKDWETTTVIIAVRDSRMHETDPLLGVIVLPLREVFKHRSQINDAFPLIGGIGYGRMRLSMTFRSVQARLPKELLGWDVGTLDIQPQARGSFDLPVDLASCRLVFQTLQGKGKLSPHSDGGWKQKRGKPVRLAVKKRYASCLVVEFRKHAFGPDLTPAFCTLWLKDIPDDEVIDVSLPVRKNEKRALTHARANATDIGERVGTLDLKLRFWPGLSGYHQHSADKDQNMADVMEALDCAEESKEIRQDLLYDDADTSSSSPSEDDKGDEKLEDEGKRGVPDEFAEYKKRKGELHRKHRGLMHWHGARNVAWIGREIEDMVEEVSEKVKGTLKHKNKEPGIENEV